MSEHDAEREASTERAYKVVEVSTVTDEGLEDALNTWVARGYVLEGMHFAMRESSKRPAMAFLVFQRAKER